jgi:hypothetical protein
MYIRSTKITLSVLLVLMLHVNRVTAQLSVSGGVAFTNLKHENIPYAPSDKLWKSQTGFFLGAEYGKTVFKDAKVNAGLGYILAGAGSESFSGENVKMHYITLPVSFSYTFLNRVSLMAGPQLNFLLKESPSMQYPGYWRVGESDVLDYGVNAGLSVEVYNHIGIRLSQYWGLKYNNETAARVVSPGNENFDFKTTKNSFLTIGVVYSFAK